MARKHLRMMSFWNRSQRMITKTGIITHEEFMKVMKMCHSSVCLKNCAWYLKWSATSTTLLQKELTLTFTWCLYFIVWMWPHKMHDLLSWKKWVMPEVSSVKCYSWWSYGINWKNNFNLFPLCAAQISITHALCDICCWQTNFHVKCLPM